jgi:hypothetical protein
LKENFDRFQFDIYKEKVMADFRKCVFAFAVLALLLGSGGVANAQQAPAFQCIANAGVPPLVRSEGVTELVGDIVLNCDGGVPLPGAIPGQALPGNVTLPTVNIRIFFNTAVTSRLLSTSGGWAESMLMIDEPVGTNFVGCLNGTTVTAGTAALCNVYQGRVVGGNSVEFLGVPVLPPSTSGGPGTRIYR